MKVVLINLPWFRDGRFGVRAGSRWAFTSLPGPDGNLHYVPFPFFLAYAAALLKKEGHDALLIDGIAHGLSADECLARIMFHDPRLVVVETSTPSFRNDISLIEGLKQRMPGVKVAVCGPHAGDFAEDILSKNLCIDFVLRGEYEFALHALVMNLELDRSAAGIDGVVYRNESSIVANPCCRVAESLDLLPWPQRDEAVIYKYNDAFAGLPHPNVQMVASRGCPFRCSFCLWPQTLYKGAGYRIRNHVDVVDEMAYLIERFHFKAVYFDDDVFNVDRKHVLGICHEILKRGIHVPWAVMARADLMDDELLSVMARAGLYAVKYGIESADDEILNGCGKRLDLDKARRVIMATKQLGIKVHLTFCVGLPGETVRSISKTVDFARESAPDSMQFSLATPFPGTEYFNYVMANDLLCSRDWDDYDGNHKCIVRTHELSDRDLETIKNDLVKMFSCS